MEIEVKISLDDDQSPLQLTPDTDKLLDDMNGRPRDPLQKPAAGRSSELDTDTTDRPRSR